MYFYGIFNLGSRKSHTRGQMYYSFPVKSYKKVVCACGCVRERTGQTAHFICIIHGDVDCLSHTTNMHYLEFLSFEGLSSAYCIAQSHTLTSPTNLLRTT